MKVLLDVAAYLVRRTLKVLAWVVSHLAVVLLVVTVSLGSAVATASSTAVFNAASFVAQRVMTALAPSPNRPVTVKGRAAAATTVDKTIRDAEARALRAEATSASRRADGLADDLRRSEARLASTTDDLARSRRALNASEVEGRRLRSEIARKNDEIARLTQSGTVRYRGRQVLVSEAVSDTADRARRRAGVAATRNVGSMFGEAIPFYGVAVIVAATAWEVKDLCDMMDDMYALEVAFDPEMAVPPDRTEACGVQVPTAAEIWAKTKASPGEVWQSTKDIYDGLPELRSALDSVTIEPIVSVWEELFGDEE